MTTAADRLSLLAWQASDAAQQAPEGEAQHDANEKAADAHDDARQAWKRAQGPISLQVAHETMWRRHMEAAGAA